MKIKESKLSNREHVVKVSNRVMKDTLGLQLLMAETEINDEDVEPLENLKLQSKMVNTVLDYITNTLKLNDKEQSKLDDLEFDETVGIANHIIMRVQGLSEEDIKEMHRKSQAETVEETAAIA